MGWCGFHPGVKTGKSCCIWTAEPGSLEQLQRMGWGRQWHSGSWPVLSALSAITLCQAASHAHTAARRDCLVQIWGFWYPDSAQSKQTAQHLRHVWGKRQLQLEGRRKENVPFWIMAWLFCSRKHSHNHLLRFKAAAAQRCPGRAYSSRQRFSARPLTPSRVLCTHKPGLQRKLRSVATQGRQKINPLVSGIEIY